MFAKIKNKLFGKPAKEVAKQRLQVILMYDRAGLPPNSVELIREKIISALRGFPFVDPKGVEVHITELRSGQGTIEIEIPVKGEKE